MRETRDLREKILIRDQLQGRRKDKMYRNFYIIILFYYFYFLTNTLLIVKSFATIKNLFNPKMIETPGKFLL